MDQVENVNGGGVGSGEWAEPRDHESLLLLFMLMLMGRGDMNVKGEAPRLGRELLLPMERSTMLQGGDDQSKLLPKASRLDWRPRRNWLAPVRFLTSAMAPSRPFPVKSLATWSCRSGSSASTNAARDGIGEPDGEEPEEEPEEDKEEEEEEDGAWLEPGDEGVNVSVGRWRLYRR